jgi:hypothetical protein
MEAKPTLESRSQQDLIFTREITVRPVQHELPRHAMAQFRNVHTLTPAANDLERER